MNMPKNLTALLFLIILIFLHPFERKMGERTATEIKCFYHVEPFKLKLRLS